MTNHGMISIPAPLRKKYGFKDGDEVLVMDDVDGFIKIYPSPVRS
ncbi:MAG TPA: AbrB/MazE/SpoVT family DNA-binding domain-containing protein [Candidatus Lokiarchaeia archaeon]|nr:AbrB/MazE/SpoVT family DNA-binding domain-containing protein [Candidatus Lokiarchaeia archaeon]